jgi:hypothetical protein
MTPIKTKEKPAAKKRKQPVIPNRRLPPFIPVSVLEMNFCHMLLKSKANNPESAAKAAAIELGLNELEGERMMNRRQVKAYLERFQMVFMERMAENEARQLLNRKITREGIAERYMQLADMPPQLTKDNIEGQITALDSLVALLGLKPDFKNLPNLVGQMTDEQLAQIASQSPLKQ